MQPINVSVVQPYYHHLNDKIVEQSYELSSPDSTDKNFLRQQLQVVIFFAPLQLTKSKTPMHSENSDYAVINLDKFLHFAHLLHMNSNIRLQSSGLLGIVLAQLV